MLRRLFLSKVLTGVGLLVSIPRLFGRSAGSPQNKYKLGKVVYGQKFKGIKECREALARFDVLQNCLFDCRDQSYTRLILRPGQKILRSIFKGVGVASFRGCKGGLVDSCVFMV